ncbi:hypothetical protein CACET_c14850 [Clostridium aceticum]|uniref:Uncharacterized protein n=1 Tax=Clostridium aceticum TaxID=84022 RepID=A0A0D8IC36_9CLOT|nr:hypothetical protein CACET_c14850 [Clostridium aceticum]KJF27860.1 hypothetical protein TZ02_04505 [Clostridium aceticum]
MFIRRKELKYQLDGRRLRGNHYIINIRSSIQLHMVKANKKYSIRRAVSHLFARSIEGNHKF